MAYAVLLMVLAALAVQPTAARAAARLDGAAADEAAVMHDLRALAARTLPTALTNTWWGWQLGDGTHPCDWSFVDCDAQRRITRLRLFETYVPKPTQPSNASRPAAADVAPGQLPPELAALSRLQRLQHLQLLWPGPHVGAALAPEWLQPGVWPGLRSLTIRLTALPGAAPLPDIPPGAFPALERLSLQLAGLQSSLPPGWADRTVLPTLRELSISLEHLEGDLPRQWAHGFPNLRGLVLISVAAGRSRRLPEEWAGGFPGLQALTLTHLGLTGSLPQVWLKSGSFPALTDLQLNGNALTGTLPPLLFDRIPKLDSLHISGNNLTGTLPAEWANCRVKTLELSGNRLTGAAFPPAWLKASMPALEYHILSNNSALGGTLPPELPFRWPGLRSLFVDGTGVSGSFPAAWCEAKRPGASPSVPLTDVYVQRTTIGPTPAACEPHTYENNLNIHRTGDPTWGDGAGFSQTPEQLAQQAEQLHGKRVVSVGLATVLPLCGVAAAGLATRALLRRQRRRHLRDALERQGLLQQALRQQEQQQQEPVLGGGGRALESGGGGPLAAGQAGRLPAPASLVRPTKREKIAALLSHTLQHSGRLVQLVEAGVEVPAGLAHQLSSPSQHRQQEQQQQQVASNEQPGQQTGGRLGKLVAVELSTWPREAPTASRIRRWLAADGGSQASRAWGLPTESLRLPFSSIEFEVSPEGQLLELGSGTFASVFLARLQPAGTPVAAKVFELEPGIESSRVWREVALMRQCRHPRIVKVLGVALRGELFIVALELMRVTLEAALSDAALRSQLCWRARGAQVALDVAQALDHLHTRLGILHSDLKPLNVLLGDGLRAHLSDLGLAQTLGLAGAARTVEGYTRVYAAPEQMLAMRCTLAADIYSFGLTLIALLSRQPLLKRGQWRLPRAPQDCPQAVLDLIESCLDPDPQLRPSAAQALACLQAAAAVEGG